MLAIKTFENYIYGTKFIIVTDHKPLLWLKWADNNTRVQKWRLKLSDYEFEVIYKPGKLNANMDELSRNPTEIFVVTRAQRKQELNKNIELHKPISNEDKTKTVNENSNENNKEGNNSLETVTFYDDLKAVFDITSISAESFYSEYVQIETKIQRKSFGNSLESIIGLIHSEESLLNDTKTPKMKIQIVSIINVLLQ